MNTTMTPGFTAEASLYNTSRHYRTRYHALDRLGRTAGTIRLSEIDVPGEVIEIEDDAPWSPPSWGGHTGPGPTGGGGETGSGEPGGGGGDGGTPAGTDPDDKPQPGLRGCSARQIQSDAARPCQKLIEDDLIHGVKNRHFMKCTGTRQGNVEHPKMQCCQQHGKRSECIDL